MMAPLLPGAVSRWVAGALVVLMIGGVLGWRVRGHIAGQVQKRLEARIAHLQSTNALFAERLEAMKRNHETLQRNNATLERSLSEQNAAIERLEAAYIKAEARRRAANRRLQDYLSRPHEPITLSPGACEELVEQARQLGSAK